jgi:hypothetical protein
MEQLLHSISLTYLASLMVMSLPQGLIVLSGGHLLLYNLFPLELVPVVLDPNELRSLQEVICLGQCGLVHE